MSWWRYRGRSTGRVLHFLYHYCGFDVAEHARIGTGIVELRGVRIATFAWSDRFGEKDVPEFTFCDDLGQRLVREESQRTRRDAAIRDALPEAPPAAERKPVDEDALLAIMPDTVRGLRIWAGIVQKADVVSYFVVRNAEGVRVLWAKAGKALLYWSREIGDWLRGPDEETT